VLTKTSAIPIQPDASSIFKFPTSTPALPTPRHVSMDGDILSGLNSAQREAVASPAGVLQVLAPPGSGKTKTLTARVAYLIGNRHMNPRNIIVCTFTNKAANEMKERIRSFIGDELAKHLNLGTFHSISLRYLKQYGQYIGLDKDFGIADASDSKAILGRIIKQTGFTLEPAKARARISSLKAKGISSEDFLRTAAKNVERQEFAQVYSEYESTLRSSNLLDYDDLLLRCRTLLTSHPPCVSNVEALLIDEFQDTNNVQYDLMQLFAQHRNTITIVGDPDQSIYGWRSAEIKNLGRMKEQWTDTLTINLQENYRSSKAILEAAQHIIEQDNTRPPKKLKGTHNFGLRPVLRKLPSSTDEARWLVSEVKRIQAVTGGLLEGNDFAVLLRSAYLSRPIETALGEAGVPYRMIGGTKFYDRAEIKLLLDYLRVIARPDDTEGVTRIVNVPARRIGDKTVESLQQEARFKNISLWTLILDVVQSRRSHSTKLNAPASKGLGEFVDVILTVRRQMKGPDGEQRSLPDILNSLLKKLGYQGYLKKKYPEDFETRWTSVEELIAQATEASTAEWAQSMLDNEQLSVIEDVEQRSTSSTEDLLSIFLANIALTAAGEDKLEQEGEKAQQLTISTIHAAKGLEWPVVFVPGCYEGSIPSSKSEDHDEERRLLYVAMTRAQAALYLSCPIKNSQREETSLSSFLAQPGVQSFFEEHGPSLSIQSVTSMAETLRRGPRTQAAIDERKRTLERDEDNYWPLNGEAPLEEIAKWDYGRGDSGALAPGTTRPAAVFTSAKVTMQQQDEFSTAMSTMKFGITSVKSFYGENMEKSRLRAVERRAEQTSTGKEDKPKGRKRQIPGQTTLQFGKDQKTAARLLAETTSERSGTSSPPSKRQKNPLQEIQNLQPATSSQSDMISWKPSLAPHPVRSDPVHLQLRAETPPQDSRYLFLSSPPPLESAEADLTSEAAPTGDATVQHSEPAVVPARPAISFHTTSMQSFGSSQRRTLGVKPTRGWDARKHK
jgi:DNA helicase II / ATP-dependent DNA helicase PcrA